MRFFCLLRPPPLKSTLFPYTTLFRSSHRLLLAGRLLPEGARDRRDLPRRSDLATHDRGDRKSTRLNSSHTVSSYAVFCLKKKRVERGGKRRCALHACDQYRSVADRPS